MDAKDQLFEQPDKNLFENFAFDEKVVAVFDDMVGRSVPCYGTIQSLLAELSLRFHGGHTIYDLGCSTGTTLQAIIERADRPLRLVGVDSSQVMLDRCREKLAPVLDRNVLDLECRRLEDLDDLSFGPAGVIVLCLVVQFLRPMVRQDFLSGMYRNLAPGGCVLMVEKTILPDPAINATFLDIYHAYKMSRGYSMTEIARKREALENRLIPFYPQENLAILKAAGFTRIFTFFSWMNFHGYLAIKDEV